MTIMIRILSITFLLHSGSGFIVLAPPHYRNNLLFTTTTATAARVVGLRSQSPSRQCMAKTNMNHQNNNRATKQNKGFQQYGEINPDYCLLSHDQIIDLIRSRNRARRSRNFTSADEILATLNRNNVHLNDSKKLWRADGETFDIKEYSEMRRYTKSIASKPITAGEEEYVNQKLNERSEAKLRRDFSLADDILDELRFLKNVIVNDSDLTWKAMDPLKTGYIYGGRRLNNVPDEEIENIDRMIRERANAKGRKEYAKADKILDDLQSVCGVRVDDTKKKWYFLPKFDDKENRNTDSERRNRSDKNTRLKIQRENFPDKDDKNIPDSISISNDKNSITESISLSSDNEEISEDISMSSGELEIPEGISITSDALSTDVIPDVIPINDEPSPKKLSPSKSELADCTVPVLKEKLRTAGLPVSGRKAELIDRLLGAE